MANTPRPVTDEDREQVRALHAQGLGRNAIARQLGRSSRTVSVLAEELGLTFDRSATAEATRARIIDTRERRQNLIERYYAQAEKILARLERPEQQITEVSIGKVVRYTAPDLPTQDVRNLIQAAGAATGQAVKLESLNTDTGVDTAKSMLGQLAAGLAAAYQAMDHEGDGDAA